MPVAASPSSVLSKGIGSWGSVNLMVTRGLGVGQVVGVAQAIETTIDFGYTQDGQWQDEWVQKVGFGYTQDEGVSF